MFGEARFRPSVVGSAAALCLWFATVIAAPAQPQSASRDPCAPLSADPPGIHAPADFTVVVDGSRARLQIRPSGEATSWIGHFQGPLRHSPMKYEVEHRRTLSQPARDRIYARVLACRFFDLDRSYVNRNVRDGWGMSVTIAAGGRSHTVGTYMVSLPRLDTIVAAARAELTSPDDGASPPYVPAAPGSSEADDAIEAAARVAREAASPPGSTSDGMQPLPEAADPILAGNGTIAAVRQGAIRTPRFEIVRAQRIERITTYHYGARVLPGTIALRAADGRLYGPWRASGAVGQGGVPNAYWWVRPNLTLPAGRYAVIDSDPATWSTVASNQGAGIYEIRGRPAD